jgi:hypothetical protein
MGNDLISRSALLKCLSINDEGRRIPEYDCDNFAVTIPIKDFKNMIRRQPTAYDVDKVIEQIKKSPSDRDGLRIFDGDEPMIHKSIAMDIVKRGRY